MKELFSSAIDEAETSALDLGAMAMGYLFGYYNWPDPAIAIHRSLYEEYPQIDLMSVNLGEMLQKSGRTEESYEVYSDALKSSPDNPYYLRMTARLASNIDKNEEAISNLLRALAQEPEDPTLHFQLGNGLRKGRLD